MPDENQPDEADNYEDDDEENEEEEDGSEEEEDDDDEPRQDDEHAPEASKPKANVTAPCDEARPAASPRKRTSMPKEDQLGPRPPMATHWRCRRVEDDGRKTTLLYHDEGDGIAVCEWPIKSCAPELIRQRWGARGGAFVVQFIHSDELGQRRPCGRSRMLILTPPDDRPPRAGSAPDVQPPPPPIPMPPVGLPTQGGGAQPDSFAQMFSLLAYMQDRDEKARAASREESRFAMERYRADTELLMERERNATKERIAQIDANAKVAGRVNSGAALGIDPELLAHKIGEAVGARVEAALEDDDDGEEPPPAAAPAPAAPADNTQKLLETLVTLANTFGPLLMQKAGDMGAGSPPPAPSPPNVASS